MSKKDDSLMSLWGDEQETVRHWHRCALCQEIRYCHNPDCAPSKCIPREMTFLKICQPCIPKTTFYKIFSGGRLDRMV